jgi:hypothetical protein
MEQVADYVEHIHKGEYLASLAKNGSKCEELVRNVDLTNALSDTKTFNAMMHALVQAPSKELGEAIQAEKGKRKTRPRKK